MKIGERFKLVVAGVTFPDPINDSRFKVLTGVMGQTTNESTPRLISQSTGYQVPSGKTFKIQAIKIVGDGVAGPVYIGYADNDVGQNAAGGTATNVTFPGGFSEGGIPLYVAVSSEEESSYIFDVPATKYLFFGGPGGGGGTSAHCYIYGYEV